MQSENDTEPPETDIKRFISEDAGTGDSGRIFLTCGFSHFATLCRKVRGVKFYSFYRAF